MEAVAVVRRRVISKTKTESRMTEQAQMQRQKVARWVSSLLMPGRRPAFGIGEMISLAVFCGLVAWCIPHHESWFDETQAWLIAKSSTLFDLVVHRLHYEGAPALWHILLWCEYRLGISFLGMRWIAGAIAAAGAYVWLRYNPLPRVIGLVVPLGFFFVYQYSVVARTYVMCPVFAFSLMALYQDRKSKPLVFAVVAGLFANCSLHMAAFSCGLALMYARDRWALTASSAPVASGGERRGMPLRRGQLVVPAMVLLALLMGSAATAIPTADGSSTTSNPLVSGVRKVTPHAGVEAVQAASATTQLDMPVQLEAPPQGRLATWAWHKVALTPGASAKQVKQGKIFKKLLVLLTAITVPISTSNVLAGVLMVLLVMALWQAGLMITLAPWVLVQLCNVLIAGEAHHIGLVWVALLCSLWALSLEPVTHGPGELVRVALYGVTLVVALLQVGWSVHSIHGDLVDPYSGSQATAAWFRTLPAGTRIAGFDDDSVAVNAYLNSAPGHSPYMNQTLLYWPYSKTRDPSLWTEQTLAERPDVVTVKASSPEHPVMDQWVQLLGPSQMFTSQRTLHLLEVDGYHLTHRFCGHRFFRDAAEATDCRLIYER